MYQAVIRLVIKISFSSCKQSYFRLSYVIMVPAGRQFSSSKGQVMSLQANNFNPYMVTEGKQYKEPVVSCNEGKTFERLQTK